MFSQQVLLSWRQFWGVFRSVLWHFFSIFWETFGFLWNSPHVFLINTLMVVRVKDFMGIVALCLELFWVAFFLGRGEHILSLFLYFLRKVRYVFMKFCKSILSITLGAFLPIIQFSLSWARNPKYSLDVSHKFSGQ